MNKTMGYALKEARREAYENGILEQYSNKPVNIRKFKEIYSPLSDKKSNYESRLSEASRLAAKMRLESGLTTSEAEYIYNILFDTVQFMNKERSKRGGKTISTEYLSSNLISFSTPKDTLWRRIKKATTGLAAAAMLYISTPADAQLAKCRPDTPGCAKPKVESIKKEAEQPTQKETKYIIREPDINIYDSCGNLVGQYHDLISGSQINVPYGGSFEVASPLTAIDTNKAGEPISLDVLVKREGRMLKNNNQLPGKKEYAFPLKIDTDQTGMTPGKYTVTIAAEDPEDVEKIKASVPLTVNVTPEQPCQAEYTAPKSHEKKTPHRKPELPSPTEIKTTEPKEATSSQKKNFRVSTLLGVTHASINYDETQGEDPFKNGFGFIAQLEAESKNVHAWAGMRSVRFDEAEPYISGQLLRMNLQGFTAGAHARKGIFMFGGEVVGTNVSWNPDTRYMASYGLTSSDTFGYNGRAGLFLGEGYDSDKGWLQAYFMLGRIIQESNIDDPRYGDLSINSRGLLEKGFGFNARVAEFLRLNGYFTTAEDSDKTVKLSTNSVSGELSFPVAAEGRLRPFVKLTYNQNKEEGPAAATSKMNFTEAAAGIKFIFKNKR